MMMMIMNLYSAKTIEEYSKALYIKFPFINQKKKSIEVLHGRNNENVLHKKEHLFP